MFFGLVFFVGYVYGVNYFIKNIYNKTESKEIKEDIQLESIEKINKIDNEVSDNEVEVSDDGNGNVTVGLPNDVTITDTFSVGSASAVFAANAITDTVSVNGQLNLSDAGGFNTSSIYTDGSNDLQISALSILTYCLEATYSFNVFLYPFKNNVRYFLNTAVLYSVENLNVGTFE